MLAIARRNVKLFFRDKGGVFFSLMSVFIVLGLYALFLKSTILGGDLEALEGAGRLVDSWLIAGVLAVAAVTTTLSGYGAMVEDRARGVDRDFAVSPASSGALLGGYILSALAVGLVLCAVTFAAGQVYLVAAGGKLLPPLQMVQALGVTALSVAASAAMLYFLTLFIKTQNAFTGACTVVGTLVGFLTGVYIPIGTLPSAVQVVVKCFPPTHGAALLRQIFTAGPMETTFAGVPAGLVTQFKEEMGICFAWDGGTFPVWGHLAVLAGGAVLFAGLSLLVKWCRRR